LENSFYHGRIEDIKATGGTSGSWLVDITSPEYFKLSGNINLNANTGCNGMIMRNVDGADFSYGESTSDAQLNISCDGANVTNLEFLGTSAKPLNLVDWYGHTWLRNDTGSSGTINLKTSYIQTSKLRGLHFENADIGIQQNTGTQFVTFEGANNYMTVNSNGANHIFVDMNAGYNCTVEDMVFWFGGASRVAIDDENDSANGPHKYRNIALWGSGGTITADLGTSAMTETYPNGKWYRQMGSGTFP
jgi:hypothetical protein